MQHVFVFVREFSRLEYSCVRVEINRWPQWPRRWGRVCLDRSSAPPNRSINLWSIVILPTPASPALNSPIPVSVTTVRCCTVKNYGTTSETFLVRAGVGVFMTDYYRTSTCADNVEQSHFDQRALFWLKVTLSVNVCNNDDNSQTFKLQANCVQSLACTPLPALNPLPTYLPTYTHSTTKLSTCQSTNLPEKTYMYTSRLGELWAKNGNTPGLLWCGVHNVCINLHFSDLFRPMTREECGINYIPLLRCMCIYIYVEAFWFCFGTSMNVVLRVI